MMHTNVKDKLEEELNEFEVVEHLHSRLSRPILQKVVKSG